MSAEIDPELEKFGRQRLVQLCEWREILSHGSDAEKRELVASLREVDLVPALSTLDVDEDEVRTLASDQRTILALTELERKMQAAIAAGDIELAATYLDLRLNAEGRVE